GIQQGKHGSLNSLSLDGGPIVRGAAVAYVTIDTQCYKRDDHYQGQLRNPESLVEIVTRYQNSKQRNEKVSAAAERKKQQRDDTDNDKEGFSKDRPFFCGP